MTHIYKFQSIIYFKTSTLYTVQCTKNTICTLYIKPYFSYLCSYTKFKRHILWVHVLFFFKSFANKILAMKAKMSSRFTLHLTVHRMLLIVIKTCQISTIYYNLPVTMHSIFLWSREFRHEARLQNAFTI